MTPEEYRAYQKAYREKHRDKISKQVRDWQATHTERLKEIHKKHVEKKKAGLSKKRTWTPFQEDREKLRVMTLRIENRRKKQSEKENKCAKDNHSRTKIYLMGQKVF